MLRTNIRRKFFNERSYSVPVTLFLRCRAEIQKASEMVNCGVPIMTYPGEIKDLLYVIQ